MRRFTAMRTLAVDYGERRVGLAVSDPTGFLASAYQVLKRESDEQVVEVLVDVVNTLGVERIVVGNPITMKGESGEKSQRAQRFAELLEHRVSVPVMLFDERLTTVTAQRTLIEADVSRKKRKGIVDAVAATVLLQHFLDTQSK